MRITYSTLSSPVSVAELKDHLRIDIDAEDHVLADYLLAATQVIQNKCRRQLSESSIEFRVRCPGVEVALPVGPVESITSVVDGDGEEVGYDLDESGIVPRLILESTPEYLVVVYVGGFEDAPDCAKHAIKILAAHFWADRESTGPIPPAVEALLDPIRVIRV